MQPCGHFDQACSRRRLSLQARQRSQRFLFRHRGQKLADLAEWKKWYDLWLQPSLLGPGVRSSRADQRCTLHTGDARRGVGRWGKLPEVQVRLCHLQVHQIRLHPFPHRHVERCYFLQAGRRRQTHNQGCWFRWRQTGPNDRIRQWLYRSHDWDNEPWNHHNQSSPWFQNRHCGSHPSLQFPKPGAEPQIGWYR